jgi:cobalt-zinc-cadmium efflux system outer membrane protein
LVVAAACLFGLGLPLGTADAQESQRAELRVTERQAVQRALEGSDLTRSWGASVTRARARAISEGAWPNPRLSYSHEQSYEEPDAVGEDFVLFEQTLPVSGRRGLRADAARARAEATGQEVTAKMAKTAAKVRTAYYEVLHLRERIAVRVTWLDGIRELEQILVQRVEAGESAAYDLERLRKETADIAADIEVDRAALAERRAQLRGMLFLSARDGEVTPTGQLMPSEIPSDASLREAVEGRPEVAAAESRVEAARHANRAASRWWVPEPTVSAGYRGASVAGEHYPGFVAGVSLTVPLFYQNGGERLAAGAELERARSQREILRRKYRARVQGLAARTRRLQEAAKTYRADGLARSKRLVEVAREAYDAGEIGILELIDAHRGLVDTRLRVLELARSARQAEIELRRNLGQASPDVERPTEQRDE